jgi:hypothetical protein
MTNPESVGERLNAELDANSTLIAAADNRIEQVAQNTGATFDALRIRIAEIADQDASGRQFLLNLIDEQKRKFDGRFLDLDAAYVRQGAILSSALERLAILEGNPIPPVPAPQPKHRWTVAGGQMLLDGAPFRDWTTNVAGYGLDSKPAEIQKFLDDLQARGVRVIRFLHPADDLADGIDDYKPTWGECLKGFADLDFWFDELAKRDMFGALTVQHRQRLTPFEGTGLKTPGLQSFLFGPRDSGITPGEIQDTFFLFPEILDIVADTYCKEFGRRYAAHPALAFIDAVDESWAGRVRGYYPKMDRLPTRQPPLNARGVAWFQVLDSYQKLTGLTDPQMTTPRIAEFNAWNGRRVYRHLLAALRNYGFTCPLGTSSIFGHTPACCLAEAELGDYVNIHRYPENTVEPDPFDPNVDRFVNPTLGSYIAACSLEGKPTLVSEWASVYQNGPNARQKTARFDVDPGPVAEVMADQGVSVAFHYAGLSAPYSSPNPTSYDGLHPNGSKAFQAAFWDAVAPFRNKVPKPAIAIELGPTDLYGFEVAGKITFSPVLGTQGWAMQAAGKRQRLSVKLPALPVSN